MDENVTYVDGSLYLKEIFDKAYEAGQDVVLVRQFENDRKAYERYRDRVIGLVDMGVLTTTDDDNPPSGQESKNSKDDKV